MANSPATNIPRMNLTVAASGVFQFKVEGYSFTKEAAKSDREYYQSDKFTVGGYDWAVRYYPSKGGHGKFEVGLALLNRAHDAVAVRFALSLLCKSGVPSDERKAVAAATVSATSSSIGSLRARDVLCFHVLHESMEEFVVEDSFVLHCTVSVLKRPASF
ncbi:unnamed protein product [Urochloa decumbens]|uniref:MATH domain-containing protein n=1 Tax=Urochloa decumbens TaxID=240449 RepID=A0ABC9GWK6_9POAL